MTGGNLAKLGGGIHAGSGFGQGRETIGGFPVGLGLQGPGGLRGLIVGGLEGGCIYEKVSGWWRWRIS